MTGVSTRKSLNCGSSRRFKASSPSNPDGPQVGRWLLWRREVGIPEADRSVGAV